MPLMYDRDDSAHGREHVLNAMVELSNQCTLVLLRPFALGDVSCLTPMRRSLPVGVHSPLWKETARLSPSCSPSDEQKRILYVVFAPVGQGSPAQRDVAVSYPSYVVRVDPARHSLRGELSLRSCQFKDQAALSLRRD